MSIDQDKDGNYHIVCNQNEMENIQFMLGHGYSNLLDGTNKKELNEIYNPFLIALGKEPYEDEE